MLWVLEKPSEWDGFFEHLKYMIEIMGKKILTSVRF